MVTLSNQDAADMAFILLQVADRARNEMQDAASSGKAGRALEIRAEGMKALRLVEKLRGDPEGRLTMPEL